MASNSAGIGGLLPPQTTDVANYILTTDGQTASWEVSSASLPAQGGNSGKFLTTDGSVASWASVSAGSLTLGAVGSTPNADGATYDSGTGDFNLEPADGTHPGVITTGTQTLAGIKNFSGVVTAAGTIGNEGPAACAKLGVVSGLGALSFQTATIPTTVMTTDGTHIVFGTPGVSGFYFFRQGGAGGGTIAILETDTFDMTGLGNGGSIKLKSPDGTTYTISVANGGTLSIV